MIAKRGLKADRKAYDNMMAIGGALLVICLLIVAGIAIAENWEGDTDVIKQAKAGSVVKVNYTGSFSNGWVFDTSDFSVANDSNVAKSFEFVLKSQSLYQPLSFTIGGGTLLAGFENAVIGMQAGDSKTITLTPAQAYGEVPAANLSVHQVNQTLDATQWMNASQFQSFFGEAPVTGLTVSHPWYGWDVQVFHYDSVADNVTVIHLPVAGEQYAAFGDPSAVQPYGWYLEVTSVDSSTIEFRHLVDASMVNTVRGTNVDGLFYLHAVDGDSFTMKHAIEKVGRTLTFTITLVEIVSV